MPKEQWINQLLSSPSTKMILSKDMTENRLKNANSGTFMQMSVDSQMKSVKHTIERPKRTSKKTKKKAK